MSFVADIGIIGALSSEVEAIITMLENKEKITVSGIDFYLGELFGKKLAVAKCGVGKVFAAICAEAMITSFSPRLVVNTGVGGALDKSLRTLDIVVADRLVQHDMDTSPLGDPPGLISGINKVFFTCDKRAREILFSVAARENVNCISGTIATGDKFISDRADKERIVSLFGASACEMEGCAVAQAAFVNDTPFAVVRAISDSADGEATMDYPTFLPIAARNSTALTLSLVRGY